MAVECGEFVEQLNEDGQIVARREETRYAIGDHLSEVLPALQELNQVARRTVTAALLTQLSADPKQASAIEVAA